MKFIKQHRQETIAILLIAGFWTGIGIKNQLEYTPLSHTQYDQMMQEETAQPDLAIPNVTVPADTTNSNPVQ